jgi:hypothetical protein
MLPCAALAMRSRPSQALAQPSQLHKGGHRAAVKERHPHLLLHTPHLAASNTMFLRTFAALAAALALASASLAQPAARSDLESRAPPCVRQKACPRGGLADQRAMQGPAGLGHVEHRLRALPDRVAIASPC